MSLVSGTGQDTFREGYNRSMRPVEPEAVFGQIKYDRGFKRFLYRGSALTSAEFATVAIAHNIKKMISVMDAERNARRQDSIRKG